MCHIICIVYNNNVWYFNVGAFYNDIYCEDVINHNNLKETKYQPTVQLQKSPNLKLDSNKNEIN